VTADRESVAAAILNFCIALRGIRAPFRAWTRVDARRTCDVETFILYLLFPFFFSSFSLFFLDPFSLSSLFFFPFFKSLLLHGGRGTAMSRAGGADRRS